jgi:serine/threonine-protein kinase RsbW
MAQDISENNLVVLTIPADYRLINVVGACIRTMLGQLDNQLIQEGLIYNIELAVHETCTNIIEHAYAGSPGRIRVEARIVESPPQLIITLHDTGHGFEMHEIQTPDPANPRTKGYGLFLVNTLMDEVFYHSNETSNHWQLVKNL